MQCIDEVVDNPVVQVPGAQVADETGEIPQLDVFEKIVETPEIQTGHGTQDRIQQSSMEQTIANPAISLAEKTVEMPVTRTRENTTCREHTCSARCPNSAWWETRHPGEINQVTKHVEIP